MIKNAESPVEWESIAREDMENAVSNYDFVKHTLIRYFEVYCTAVYRMFLLMKIHF